MHKTGSFCWGTPSTKSRFLNQKAKNWYEIRGFKGKKYEIRGFRGKKYEIPDFRYEILGTKLGSCWGLVRSPEFCAGMLSGRPKS